MLYAARSLFISLVTLCCVCSIYPQNLKKDCPKLEIVGPSGQLFDGDSFEFNVVANDGPNIEGAQVKWTVSLGVIAGGNGTPKITVTSVSQGTDKNLVVTAAVTIHSGECSSLLSGVWPLKKRIPIGDPDIFPGKCSLNDTIAIVDNIFTVLDRNPDREGVFVIQFGPKTSRSDKISKIRKILYAIKLRKYDPSRVSFVFNPQNNTEQMRILLLPLDDVNSKVPEVIKAEEISARLKSLFR